MQINPVSHPHAPVPPLYLFLFGSSPTQSHSSHLEDAQGSAADPHLNSEDILIKTQSKLRGLEYLQET